MERKFEAKAAKRLLKLVIKGNELRLSAVAVCILFSSLAMVVGISFLKPLVDNYIEPLIGSKNPDYAPMLKEVVHMGLIFVFGTVYSYIKSGPLQARPRRKKTACGPCGRRRTA